MSRAGLRSAAGFLLVEVLVALLLTLVVTAAVMAVTDSARDAAAVQLERADMEQRLRVAVRALSTDLDRVGAGVPGADGGPLTFLLAPVLPYRVARSGGDPPGSFASDTLTLMWVPDASPSTTLRMAVSPGYLRLDVTGAGCPPATILCGFEAGTSVLVHDAAGRFDTFRIESIASGVGVLSVTSPGGVLNVSYPVGSIVMPVLRRSYSLATSTAGVPQLVFNDGDSVNSGNTAVADHVVSLGFEYFADPQPPVLVRPISDPAGPWTSYGPPPPPVSSAPSAFPAGENCAFAVDAGTGLQVPRLPLMGDGQSHRPLVGLAAPALADGPWCPDGTSTSRFDADLLRIRRVAVTVRIESAIDSLRGPAGALFVHAGTARSARRLLPDREVRFQVTPPNLNLRP